MVARQPTASEFAQAIDKIRACRVRAPDKLTLAERKQCNDRVAEINRRKAIRADPTISVAVKSAFEQAKRAKKTLGAVALAIAELLPEDLQVQVVGCKGGVLTLAVPDYSKRYNLDRVLRAGSKAAMLRRVPANINNIKLVVSPPARECESTRGTSSTIEDLERDRWEEIDSGAADGSPIEEDDVAISLVRDALAWMFPDFRAGLIVLQGLSGGLLVLAVRDDAYKVSLDRYLRSGRERRLRELVPSFVTEVRVVVIGASRSGRSR